jgi:hypothetical protein
MRRVLITVALLAAVTPAFAVSKTKVAKAAKADPSLALSLDEVRTLTFETPVSTVYIGNPTIADVTMIDARHAFVQGKGYGRTNIMALNHDNVMVYNNHVTVTGIESGGTVTLHRGTQRVTLNCVGSHCEATPTPGDGKDSYEGANSQVAGHQATVRGAAMAEAKN